MGEAGRCFKQSGITGILCKRYEEDSKTYLQIRGKRNHQGTYLLEYERNYASVYHQGYRD